MGKEASLLAVVIVAFTVGAPPVTLGAETISKSYVKKIAAACEKSIVRGNRKIPNYEKVCRCIADGHYESATEESSVKEGKRHIEWALKFYETVDEKELQRLVDKNPPYSAYDDLIVDDCIESESAPVDK